MKNLKQLKNLCVISGVLTEKNLDLEKQDIKLEDGTVKKGLVVVSKTNRPASITLTNNKGTFEIQVYGAEYNKKGEKNKMFPNILNLINSYVSKQENSENGMEPTYVKCKCTVSGNEYINKNGDVVYSSQIRMNSINQAKSEEDYDNTDIDIVGAIRSITPEIKNEEETGRLNVEILNVNYRGSANIVKVIVDTDYAEDFEDMFEVNDTSEFYFNAVSTHVGGEKKSKKAALGRAANISSGYDILEFILVGAEEKYEEDSELALSLETIKALMKEKDMMLEQKKSEWEEKDNGSNSSFSSSKGLGTRKKQVEDFDSIEDDDLPF